jgi:hypothetical protein
MAASMGVNCVAILRTMLRSGRIRYVIAACSKVLLPAPSPLSGTGGPYVTLADTII